MANAQVRLLRAAPVLVLAAVLLPVAVAEPAGDLAPTGAAITYRVVPGASSVGFDASSTLHRFEGSSSSVRGEVRFVPGDPASRPTAHVEVDAASLETGVGGRDRKMRKLLEVETHPAISFDLERVSDVRIDAANGAVHARIEGRMTIRGQQQPLSLEVDLRPGAHGHWTVVGAAPLDMTEYGIKPPRVMGFIRVAPEVTLRIALELEPAHRRHDDPAGP